MTESTNVMDKSFALGDKVFAKVKGYPPWPATINSIKDVKHGKRYIVTFHGTQETSNFLKLEDIFNYKEYKDKMLEKYAKKRDFMDAVHELEEELAGKMNNGNEGYDTAKENQIVNAEIPASPEPKVSKNTTPSMTKGTKRPHSSSQSSDELNDQPPPPKRSLSISVRKSSINSSRKKSLETTSPGSNHEHEDHDDGAESEMQPPMHGFSVIFASQLKDRLANLEENIQKLQENGDIPAKETRKEKQLFLLARNPDGNFIGIKVGAESGSETPSTSEMARLRHLSNSISNALQYKSDVERGEVAPDPARVVTNLQLSVEERILAIEASVVERKQQRLKWLQTESKLVEHDSEIKSYLGLEKADTEKALECLNQILNLNVEQLMLTKHPHVIDMVKRLRRYIGNIKSWNLSREQIDGFAKGAELIRKKADEVYQKFKALYQMEPEKTFSDIYNEHVADFKEQTKHMTEPQRFAVCAKPGTKLFESDEVDDKLEVEAIKLKNEIDKKKTPKGSTMNFDA